MQKAELKEFLDQKVLLYNNPKFIESDPIQIPHQFSKKEDVEISAFLTATISWGNRTMIIKNAFRMMELLDNSPHDFIMNHKESDLKTLENFVHRTFNFIDFICPGLSIFGPKFHHCTLTIYISRQPFTVQ